jgi:hypothetical protein
MENEVEKIKKIKNKFSINPIFTSCVIFDKKIFCGFIKIKKIKIKILKNKFKNYHF